jgi:hypothetical protein
MLSAMEKYYGIKREVRYISLEGLSRNRAHNAAPAAQPRPAAPPPVPEEECRLFLNDQH